MTKNYNSSGDGYMLLETLQQDTGSSRTWNGPPLGKTFTRWMLSLALILIAGANTLYGQTNIANYSFSATTGATYTAITGGTVAFSGAYDNSVSSTAVSLGGTFTFGGTAFTTCYISTNGFITFGAAPSSSTYTPLSTLGSTTGAIAAFAQDAGGSTVTGASPEIRYQTVGSEFIVQFKDHANFYNKATERLNFQIRLNLSTNAINIVYGSCTDPGTSTSGSSVQVGIRGNSVTYSTNVNGLYAGNIPSSTTCDWSKAVSAFSNSSALLFSAGTNVNVKIPSGLTYTWTPGTQAPVRTFSAPTGITSSGATLSWTAPTGATTYNVQYRAVTDCNWTNWSGNPVTGTSVTLSGLTPSTAYQVRVQAVNGSAVSAYSHIPNSAGTGDGYVAAGTFSTTSASPTLTGGTLTAFGGVCINTTSTANSFTLSGINLTGDVTVNALSGYTYSTTSGGTYTSTLTLTPTSGSISQTVFVKLSPVAVTSYNGNILISGGGATSINVAASGSGVNTAPTLSTNGTAGSITLTSAAITGATISALGCSSVTAYGIEYSTTSGFTGGTGTQVAGTGFSGAAGGTFTAALSGLSNSTTYYYRAYATNSGGTTYYSSASSFSTLVPNQIGTGTGTTNAALPVSSYYGYTYSQQIYLASEISSVITSGNTYITKIRFKPVSVQTPQSTYNNWTVYMGNTSKTVFTGTSASDYVAASAMTQVFSGTIATLANNTWVELTLSTPFLWDGTSNIVVAVDENAASYTDSDTTGTTWLAFASGTARGVYYRSDTVNADPLSPPTTGTTQTSIPQLQFESTTPPSCTAPGSLVGAATAYNAGTATWAAPSTGATPTGYEWELRTSGAGGSGSTGLTASGTTTTAGTISYGTALTANTTYTLYVRTNCGSGTFSTWASSVPFTTPCAPISTFPYTENFNSVTTPALPSCWTVRDNNADGDKWITYTTYGTGGSNAAGIYTDFNAGANDDYLILPAVTLTGNQRLRFSVAAQSSAEPNEYRVVMSTTNSNPSSFTTVLQALTTVSNTTQTPTSWIDLSAYTGTVYIAIHVPAGTLDGYYLYVDDVTIEDKPIVAIASGEFSNGANWQGGVAPTCSTSATIPSGMNMTVTSGTAAVKALEILSGGSLSVSAGTLTVAACTGNSAALSNAGSLTVSGGTLNVNGYISNATGSTFSQSGGAINIDGNDNGATATSVASGVPLLGFGSSSASFATGTISLTSGTLTVVDPHTATSNTNAYAIYAYLSSGVSFNASTAHTVRFGDGTSTQSGGNTSGFYWTGFASSGRLNLGTVVVNNPSGTNRNVTQTGTNVINGDLTVTAGTYDQGTATTNIGGNVAVSGTFITGGTVAFGTTTGTSTIAQQSAAQSISVSGSGAIVNAATSATSNFNNIQFHNTSSAGVTINMLNNVSANTNVAANAVGTITFNGKATTPSGKALLMGTAAALSGASVTVTSGGLTPGSTFARGWTAAQTGSSFTAGSVPGNNSLFPFIDGSGYNRQAWIERVTPSAAGILAVTYTDGAGTTDVSITDGAYTVDKRSQGKWTVSKLGTAEASATYKLAVSAVNVFGGTPSTANARITTASGVLGTYQAGTNLPHAQRTGLTATDLTGQDFYIGIANSEVPFISVATGNWNDGTTWNKGTVPTASDFATIASGHTVTVDGSYTAASANLTVNSGGILAVSANTLALGTISNAGTVTVTGGALNTTTSVTNSGTFTVSGGSVTTTTSLTNSGTLNVSGGTVTTTTTLTNSSGANLNLSAGTLAVTTTYTNAGTFTGTGGTLNVTGGSTTGITNSGTFVVNGVTANLGTVANVNDRTFSSTGGTLTVTTGSLNVNGNMTVSAGAFNQAGGNINIDGNGSTNSVASGTYLLNITTSNVNWTGGTTTIVDPHASGSYAFYYSGSTASNITTGTHTFRLGDGVSTTTGSTTYGFYLYTWGTTRFSFRNLEVNGGSAAGRFTYTIYGFGVNGNLIINANSEYRDAGTTTYVAGNVVNNGTYTNTGALYMGTYISGTAGASSAAQTISGSGTWRNSTTTTTANLAGFTVNNTNAAGVTLSVPLSVSGTLTLTAGKVVTTSSSLLTLGTATAAGTLSGGSTTAYIDGPFARTFAASRTASGTYSVATLFPVGKGTSYLPLYVDPSTSAGGAVGIKGEAFTSNSGTMGTSVTSLGTNRWEALATSGAANLTNAYVRLGDAAIVSTNKILQASSAAGSYEALPLTTVYAAATPNTITTQNAIDAAGYLGYFSYGNLNSCTAPTAQATGFTVAALTTTTVTASYTAATGGASHYLVVAYPTGSTPTAPADYATPTAASLGTGAIILYNGTALTFTGSGLTANTGYDVYVYSYNNSGCYGPVFNTTAPLTSSFTTCATATGAPGTPTVSSLSDTTLNVAWTASSTAGVNYILEVATNSSFTSYVSGYNNVNVGTALTANLTGLTVNTTYYVRVRAALGSCYSTNTAYLTTATICSTVTAFTQNFDASTSLPSCWVKVGSTGTANIQASSSQSSPNCLYMYSSTTTSRAVVSMPPVSNAGANTHWLKFSYRANFTVGETIEVGYLTNPSDVSTFVSVTSVTASALTYVSTTVDLGTAPGANTVLAFRTGTATYSVLIDDVIWEAKPTCYVPTGLTSSSVTTTGATISWSAPATTTPTEYDYEVRLSGAAGSGASGLIASGTVTAPATSQVVTGLTSGTSYSVYVRSNCGGSDYSSWSAAYTLNTVCTAYTTLPHSESFDSAALPICWSTGGTGTWAPDDANDSASASHSGARFAGLAWTGDSNLDALLVSPMYNLNGDTRSVRLSVWIYRGSNGLSTDRLYFYANTTASLTGATQLLDMPLLYTGAPAETAAGWYKYTVNVPDSFVTGGNFYIIARGTLTTSLSSYSIAFDDYTLEYRPTTITNFTPGTVCSQDSQTVTITGLNFNSASAVKFNGVNAASYSVVNNTTITAVTPVGVTAGNITVTTPLNTATSATSLAVTNNPTVADITGGGVAICSGGSVALSSATGGGTWTSSDTSIATVNSSTGVVTGVAAGTVTITYTVTTSGCSSFKTATVTVNQAPSIASYTLSQTVTPGGSASYSVVASGTGLTYQWEISTNGGSSFSALSNDSTYSGVATSTLAISGIDSSMNGYRYRAVVSGASPCGTVISSTTGSVLNVSNVGIAAHPLDVSLCSNGTGLAQFNVTGTGAGLTYEWFENSGSGWHTIANGTTAGVTYSGQGTASLSLSGVSTTNNGWQYFVTITDETSSQANSNPATLTVNQAVAIGTQPSNGTVCSTGGTTNFAVSATGTGLGYQWQYATSASGPWSNVANTTPAGFTYSGVTTATLAVTAPSGLSAGTYYYQVIVSGASPCGSVTSGVASLTINIPAVTTQPTATSVLSGNSATMSVATSASAPTYQWQYSADGVTGWANVANGTPTAMSYSGSTSATLTLSAGGTISAGSGYYRAVVTSGGCSTNSNAAMLTINSYCSATFTNAAVNDYVSAMTIATTTFSATPAQVTTAPYYSYLTGGTNTTTLYNGFTYTANVTVGTSGTTQGVGVWIDLNNDGDFIDTGEFVGSGSVTSGSSGTLSIVMPSGTTPGNKRMRIRTLRNGTLVSGNACGTLARGNTVDFVITVAQPNVPSIASVTPTGGFCAVSGTITINGTDLLGASLQIGSTSITPITVNSNGTQITATIAAGTSGTVTVTTPGGTVTGGNFTASTPPTLTLSASTITTCAGSSSSAVTVTAGLSDYDTYNWLPASGVSGTAAAGFTFNPSVTTTYTLTASNASGCTRTASIVVTVNALPVVSSSSSLTAVCSGQSVQLTGSSIPSGSPTGYCTPAMTTVAEGGDYIANFTFAGINNTSEDGNGAADPTVTDYTYYSSLTANVTAGTSYPVSLQAGGTTSTYAQQFRIWVDMNRDGAFTASESVFATTASVFGSTLATGTITIPTTALSGVTRMRVASRYSSVPGTGAFCTGESGWGEYEDYNINITGGVSSGVVTWLSSNPSDVFYSDAALTTVYTSGAVAYVKPTINSSYTASSVSNGCTGYATPISITVNDKTWTGAAGTSWNVAGNWCGNQVPMATDNVVIPAVTNQPVVSGNITALAASISVATGATLTVQSGNVLNVTNGVAATGTVTLQNNAHLVQGAAVTTNPNTGSIVVKRNSTPLYRQDYTAWSSPVASQNLLAFSPNTLEARFYTFNTGTNAFAAIAPATNSFQLGRGYLIRMPNGAYGADGTTPTGTFTTTAAGYQGGSSTMTFNGQFAGVPNSGNVSVALSTAGTAPNDGFNLVGNPYPSPISIPAFFAANTSNINGYIWVWRKKNSESVSSAYCTVNSQGEFVTNHQEGATDPNGILQTGQGFIVKAVSGSNLVFNNGMRSTSTTNDASFFRMSNTATPPQVESHRFWLNLADATHPVAQMMVGYKSNATMGVDPMIDAPFINDAQTGLNSIIDAVPYAIQGRSLPFDVTDEVPLHFKAAAAGNFTISLDHMDGLFLEGQDIFLKDNVTGTIHDIKAGNYTFTSAAGTFASRFSVIYQNTALGTDNPVLDANSIVIYKNDGKLHINTGVATMKNVTIFDIRGRLVYSKDNVNASSLVINDLHVEEQMLIVKVTTTDNATASKKVVY